MLIRTSLSQHPALSSIRESEAFIDLIWQIKRYENFANEQGFKYTESYTNFITYLFDDTMDSTKIADALLKRGVIIRNLASYGMNAIRITIGTEKQNDVFFKHFTEVTA